MRRHCMIATLAILGAVVPVNSAFAAKRHPVSFSTKEVDVSTTPGPSPQGPPSASTALGLVSGTITGLIRADLHPLAGKGTFEVFTRRGTFHATMVFTDKFGPTGVVVDGSTTVTGGTGVYAHARGTLHLTGLVDPKTGNANTHQAGTLTY